MIWPFNQTAYATEIPASLFSYQLPKTEEIHIQLKYI